MGEAYSLANPRQETITPDDRQSMIEIVGGVVVQDLGRITDGDKITWTLQFWKDDWEIVKGYWNNRTIVSITDAANETFQARIVVKRYARIYKFEKLAIEADIELWKI